jgi:hypothetical protein
MPECPQEAVIKWVGKYQSPRAMNTSHIDFCSVNHSWPLWHWALMPNRMQSMVLSCMWGPGYLMLVQPGYSIYVWGDFLTCPNYWSNPIRRFSICELLVCIEKIKSTKIHWITWSTCRVIPIYVKNPDKSENGCLKYSIFFNNTFESII